MISIRLLLAGVRGRAVYYVLVIATPTRPREVRKKIYTQWQNSEDLTLSVIASYQYRCYIFALSHNALRCWEVLSLLLFIALSILVPLFIASYSYCSKLINQRYHFPSLLLFQYYLSVFNFSNSLDFDFFAWHTLHTGNTYTRNKLFNFLNFKYFRTTSEVVTSSHYYIIGIMIVTICVITEHFSTVEKSYCF